MIEKRRRSILKALSWRVTATITTMIISLIITGNLIFAVKIGLTEAVAKMFLYYLHERFWIKIKFGLHRPLDYQI